jgi:hypothetical protein
MYRADLFFASDEAKEVFENSAQIIRIANNTIDLFNISNVCVFMAKTL